MGPNPASRAQLKKSNRPNQPTQQEFSSPRPPAPAASRVSVPTPTPTNFQAHRQGIKSVPASGHQLIQPMWDCEEVSHAIESLNLRDGVLAVGQLLV